MQPARAPKRLRAENLTRNGLKDLARHLHECFSGWAGEVAVLGRRRDVALNEKVAPFSQDRGGAAAAPAEHLVPGAVCSDDFMDFHYFY